MKVRRPFADLVQPAQELLNFFAEAGVVCELGGSMRRHAATVGDIDIVVLADSLDSVVLPEWLDYVRSGEKAAHGEMDLDGQILGVDIWCATPNQWGAFLWYITGSKELNVIMRQKAKAQGMKLSQFGLFRDGVQIDDGTEHGVAEALGMDWIDPVDRQKFAAPVGITHEVRSSCGEKTYSVVQNGFEWSCSCPHHTYRKVICKHIMQVSNEVVLAA
jgi:DNA polymerase (family 10)